MGFMYLMQNFQTERLIASVSAISGCELALAFSREYGEQRKAFGKPIIKREYWQHEFVKMYIDVEMAKAFVYKVVDAYNPERYVEKKPLSMETVKLISMAKVAVGDVMSRVMDNCLQFHGGWGYIEEYRIARAGDVRTFAQENDEENHHHRRLQDRPGDAERGLLVAHLHVTPREEEQQLAELPELRHVDHSPAARSC
jgi:alkylation response protein AidB-like acyl-CoA dehydrogenase